MQNKIITDDGAFINWQSIVVSRIGSYLTFNRSLLSFYHSHLCTFSPHFLLVMLHSIHFRQFSFCEIFFVVSLLVIFNCFLFPREIRDDDVTLHTLTVRLFIAEKIWTSKIQKSEKVSFCAHLLMASNSTQMLWLFSISHVRRATVAI